MAEIAQSSKIRGRFGPQPGPQNLFCATPADIAFFGGSAFGGKTASLCLEAARNVKNPLYYPVLFRRTIADVIKPGSLLDSTAEFFPRVGGKLFSSPALVWRFPSGARITLSHLQHEKDKIDWQGAQLPFIGFDEVTHFTYGQFFYLMSRNRSLCGVKPYMRATCNPDPDSWVAEFLAWWINQDTGLAIEERSGKIRWLHRLQDDSLEWADTAEELVERFGLTKKDWPKSVTFIRSSLEDNKIGVAKDPTYEATLNLLPLVDRERLKGGNWKIRPAAGLMFRKEWCEIVDSLPQHIRFVRGWDLAGTPKTPGNDPDWSVGLKIGVDNKSVVYLVHVRRLRDTPAKVEEALTSLAKHDDVGTLCPIGIPQDPGQAGKYQVQDLVKKLIGHSVETSPETGDKVTRFKPVSSYAEHGNVKILKSFMTPEGDQFLAELENFPDGKHDDDADAFSRAFAMLIGNSVPIVGGAGETREAPFSESTMGGMSAGQDPLLSPQSSDAVPIVGGFL